LLYFVSTLSLVEFSSMYYNYFMLAYIYYRFLVNKSCVFYSAILAYLFFFISL